MGPGKEELFVLQEECKIREQDGEVTMDLEFRERPHSSSAGWLGKLLPVPHFPRVEAGEDDTLQD